MRTMGLRSTSLGIIAIVALLVFYMGAVTYQGKDITASPYELHDHGQQFLKALYHSNDVNEFRKKYINTLLQNADKQQYRVIYRDKGAEQGFCSFFNMLLMSFHYASLDGVNRLFQLNTETFGYGKWSDYFYPLETIQPNGTLDNNFNFQEYHQNIMINGRRSFITSDLANAQFEGLEVSFFVARNPNAQPNLFAAEKNEPRIPILGMQHMNGHFYHKVYMELNGALGNNLSIDQILKMRRILCQSLWEPLPPIRKEIDSVRKRIIDANNQVAKNFIAVHVRRGDKVNFESGDHQPKDYLSIIEQITKIRYDIDAILLVSDDVKYLSNLKQAIENSKEVDNSVKIYFINDLFTNSDGDSLTGQGWEQGELNKASKEQVYRHMKELIVSLSVMSQADYVVCTFSSNICRLIQMLRTQPAKSVFSLDSGWNQF